VFVSEGPQGVRVAVTGAGPCVFRASTLEAALARSFTAQALASIQLPADELNNDLHASAAYRAHLIGVLAKRAVAQAV
jgi:carbon-monoxide dehydrogenase medium subunit